MIADYQAEKGLMVSGVIDDELLNALGINEEKPVEDESKAQASPSASMPMGGTVTGDFDEPALINPEERYETFFEKTDGSEYPMYVLLDQMNDEAKDIIEHGALYMTENQPLNDEGHPTLKVKMALQDCPYGRVMISESAFLWMKTSVYLRNH